jgi:hypothetical protein
MTAGPDPQLAAALPDAARDVEEFVVSAGWDQPPQLFALVRTSELLAAEPGVTDQLDVSAPLTPVAQEPLPQGDLHAALTTITWPPTVAGCAAAVQIVVLPPDAEAELAAKSEQALKANRQSEMIKRLAAEHPLRREAWLIAAVLRDGPGACVLRLRGDAGAADELVEHPNLAPNLLDALRATFEP